MAPRAALAAVNAALERGQGFQTERVRQALLADREHGQRQIFEETERGATTAHPVGRGSLAAAVDPGPTSATPLVADAFGRRPDDPATATLTMPDDLPTGTTANQMDKRVHRQHGRARVSPGGAEKFFEFDALTLDEEPDPDAPPDAAELAIAREVVEL